jgi:TatA/E family protein of Tat protein translocase
LEIIIVLVIILILFGGWRLPKVSRGIGRTIGYLKKAATEMPLSNFFSVDLYVM